MVYRRRRSLGEWRDLLEEYESGSEDLSSFCCRHDVSLSTFLSKRRALKRSENVLEEVGIVSLVGSPSVATIRVGEVEISVPVEHVGSIIKELRC